MEARTPNQVLNVILLWYMAANTLFMTLVPFRFTLPTKSVKISVWSNLDDMLINVALFIPLGFLYQLVHREQRTTGAWGSLQFGLLFSAVIEISQLFLEKRYTTLMDVITNGLGAWIGALVYLAVRKYFVRNRRNYLEVLAIDLPVMNILYLMIPLMWLNSLAIGLEKQRLWIMLLPGLSGAIVLGEIYYREIRSRSLKVIFSYSLAALCWFLLGAVLSIAERTTEIFVIGGFVFLLTFVLSLRAPLHRKGAAGYENTLISLVFAFFVPYLLLVFFLPIGMPELPWKFRFGISGIPENPPNVNIFRVLEYLAAISLLGYILSQLIAKAETALFSRKMILATLIFWIPGTLELLRGFHPLYETSALQYALTIAAGFAGVLIYRVQLGTVRRLRITRHSSQVRKRAAS